MFDRHHPAHIPNTRLWPSGSPIRQRSTDACQPRAPAEPKSEQLPASDGKFVDAEFPPETSSLVSGANAKDQAQELLRRAQHGVTWRRGSQFASKLFNTIDPNDISQGQIGDCWLLAGIAAIAEFPDRIRWLFQESELTKDGKYNIRIFDAAAKVWTWVTIDDYIPFAQQGGELKPLGAQPRECELWVLLLEKACAKWFGSYAKINGGFGLDTFMILTEWKVCRAFTQGADGRQFAVKCASMLNAKDRLSYRETALDHIATEQMFEELKRADEQDFIMVAHTTKSPPPEAIRGYGPNNEPIATDGIVKGHCYSLIGIQEIEADGLLWRVLQVRNPWGGIQGAEWTGTLSDGWSGWASHPELRRLLRIDEEGGLDGMFYMTWEDFLVRFSDAGIAYGAPRVDQDACTKASVGTSVKPGRKSVVANGPAMDLRALKPLPPMPSFPPPPPPPPDDCLSVREAPTLRCLSGSVKSDTAEEAPSLLGRRSARIGALIAELRAREGRQSILAEVGKALLAESQDVHTYPFLG